eukprot:scaffold2068_cov226-Pinguiococcus_pyrenoidosus.AAC.4
MVSGDGVVPGMPSTPGMGQIRPVPTFSSFTLPSRNSDKGSVTKAYFSPRKASGSFSGGRREGGNNNLLTRRRVAFHCRIDLLLPLVDPRAQREGVPARDDLHVVNPSQRDAQHVQHLLAEEANPPWTTRRLLYRALDGLANLPAVDHVAGQLDGPPERATRIAHQHLPQLLAVLKHRPGVHVHFPVVAQLGLRWSCLALANSEDGGAPPPNQSSSTDLEARARANARHQQHYN